MFEVIVWTEGILHNPMYFGSIPHPVIGTAKNYCGYIKALTKFIFGGCSCRGLDLIHTQHKFRACTAKLKSRSSCMKLKTLI